MIAEKTNISLFRNRVIYAGFWSLGGHGLSQVIRLGCNLIMTRLLVPEMFGVIAIANMLMTGLALFSDVGLNLNIVQSKRSDDPVFLNTMWTIQILRGISIWLLALFVSSGFYHAAQVGWTVRNSVYADPLLPFVITAISFSAVITGFDSTRMATSMRHLEQKTITLLEISCQFAGLFAMLAWVSMNRSVWALVAGNIVGAATRMILSHVVLPGLANRLEWNADVFREALHFGKWIFLSSIIGFLLNNGDRVLLGGFLGAKDLGLYSIAFLMINAVQMAVSKLNSAVVFPALSEVVRERGQQLKMVYYKFRLLLDSGLLFIAGFLFVAGGLVVKVLYDVRYAEVGPILQILSLILVAQRYALADQCYLAIGKPKLLTKLIAVRVAALYSIVPVGFYFYGMNGSVWAIVVSSFVSVPVSLYLKAKHGILDITKEILVLPLFLLGVTFGILIIWVFR